MPMSRAGPAECLMPLSRAFPPFSSLLCALGGHCSTWISQLPLASCWVQPVGALAGGRGWEEKKVGVFILLATSLLGCGLAVTVSLCGRAQLFGGFATATIQPRLSPGSHTCPLPLPHVACEW